MSEMIYHGKVKQLWSTDDPDVIEFRYTDQISVFDQIIPSLIPRKGESLNRTSCYWFDLVKKRGICDTHVLNMSAPDKLVLGDSMSSVNQGRYPKKGRMSSYHSR